MKVVIVGGVAAGPKVASKIIHAAGFENVRVMDGGVVMWPY